MSERFRSIHHHRMLRVAAATPPATVGDAAANADATIALAREADAAAVDLMVFPELNITSYAIDDLHLQSAMQAATLAAIEAVRAASADLRPVLLVGAAIERNGRLYNCAVAIARGRVLGVVPKTFLPNYREYYEKRWFASGIGLTGLNIQIGGERVPFGTDLIFAADDLPHFVFHAEICEDYWAPTPPSTNGALAGALVCCNLSASNVVIGKSRERMMLSASQSARAICAYVYSAAGPGESTTDLAWDGQGSVHELGELLASSSRFAHAPELLVADVDCERLIQERLRNGTFNDAARALDHPEFDVRRISFAHRPDYADVGLRREIRRFPFVPNTPDKLDEDCFEAFNIQVEGIAKRLQAVGAERLVIGVSGGLDSTHALIVAAKALDRLGRPRSDILGITMPGFATSEGTKGNAWALMRALGCTAEEIDIRPAATRMLADMGHPFGHGEPVYDVTFENVQAGLRTDYLFRIANQRSGLVVGTGDLSELALGWCTYGVGDQMSHYAVNAGVPKTLIQFLIRWAIDTDQYDAETDRVLAAILGTEISPELVPGEQLQSTESKIGPYALNDFFAHYVIRHGLASGGALSPRGDWRAPSDGTAKVWLDELAANGP
jgi:NAD+ synthase (glutamine-hydrolysing)